MRTVVLFNTFIKNKHIKKVEFNGNKLLMANTVIIFLKFSHSTHNPTKTTTQIKTKDNFLSFCLLICCVFLWSELWIAFLFQFMKWIGVAFRDSAALLLFFSCVFLHSINSQSSLIHSAKTKEEKGRVNQSTCSGPKDIPPNKTKKV